MIDPKSGFAPPEFQGQVGPCLVAKADGSPYTELDHGVMHDYLGDLLELYGEDEPVSKSRFTPLAFQTFLRRYFEKNPGREEVLSDCSLVLSRVRLTGLQSAQGALLNNQEGFRGAVKSDGRHPVHLLSGRTVAAKPENIEEVPELDSEEDE
jgi:hypothetical protein